MSYLAGHVVPPWIKEAPSATGRTRGRFAQLSSQLLAYMGKLSGVRVEGS